MGRWLSREPYNDKLILLYNFCLNMPFSIIDILGLESVIVSGGINTDTTKDKHDQNWRNFITSAHAEIEEITSKNKKECILWLVEYNTYRTRNYNDEGNYESYINEIKSIADEYDNVTLCFYKSKEELREKINVDTTGQPRSEEAGNQITQFYFYGHGVIGELVLDADMANGWKNKVSWTKEDVKAEAILFKSSISKKAHCDSWACNTATKDVDNQSFAGTWKEVYGVKLYGTIGKTDYSPVGDSLKRRIWAGIWGEYRKPTLGKQNDGKTPSIRN